MEGYEGDIEANNSAAIRNADTEMRGSPWLVGFPPSVGETGKTLKIPVPEDEVLPVDLGVPALPPLSPQAVGTEIGVASTAAIGVVVASVSERPGKTA